MTIENLILIKGGTYNEVKKALKQWINLYVENLPDDLVFKLFKNSQGTHIIQVDERLDNDMFYFLVNYLNYPEWVDYKIDIVGFTVGKESNILKDKELLVYISPTDKEGDNVFVSTSKNENFKVGFGGKITETKEKKIFKQPIGLVFENPEIIKVDKSELKQRQKKETLFRGNIAKRFKIIFIIFAILFLSTNFILFGLRNNELFKTVTMILCYGIWMWFFMDYKMLRENKFYVRCLGIAILCGFYGIILGSQYNNNEGNLLKLCGISPLTFLILQKPIRLLYLKLFNKEPEINRAGSFTDFIYTLILFLGPIVLPMLIMDKIS